MKVAFFGAFDPGYPRTVVLREALESCGVEVRSIGVASSAPALAREISLVLRWARASDGLHALLVPAFGHRDVPLAALLGRLAGSPVLFDPLVSRWDTQVGDLGRVREGTLSAARLRASDRLALSLADLVLCDTWEHGDFYSTAYRVPRRKLWRVPVGADRAAFGRGETDPTPPARAGGSPLEVVFVGGFLPLHGVETIVGAARILEERRGADFARFTLIGSGMTAWGADRDIAALGLRSVRRRPRVPYPEALEALARADVALGIFGTTAKASRVVPHKVFQALALGRPVVTRRSQAVAEFFRAGEHLLLVPPGDPEALAGTLESLAQDAGLRERIGAAGRASSREQASPERIGALLLEAIAHARESTAPRPGR